jgi:multiple sugar transport system ATP-binding protein
VALGRAIVRHPQVFLFDEPLSNLDAKLRVQMRVELKKLHNRLNTTAVYVTHDQVEAMTLGDRVVVMRGGVVQQVGEPLELYNTPVNRFVAGFIGSPAMNFASVHVTNGTGGLRAGNTGLAIDVPAEISSRLAPYAGHDVIMGVRPEDMEIANGGDPPGLCFEALVEVVERLGAEILLDLQVGQQTMVASVEPNVRAKRGDKLRFALRPERLHFFDTNSEAAI